MNSISLAADNIYDSLQYNLHNKGRYFREIILNPEKELKITPNLSYILGSGLPAYIHN